MAAPTAPSLVFPGDEIAIAEEFIPGDGTYEENGTVYAARLGRLELDTSDFIAKVHAVTKEPLILKAGDIVIGTVQAVRPTMAIVEVRAVSAQPNRQIGSDTNGTLHISKVSEHYVDNLEDALKLGAVLRAVVLETKPAVQLSTKGPEFGILKLYCARCRNVMEKRGSGLVCPECDWKETVKLAADYGSGHLVAPQEYIDAYVPPPRAPRERRGGFGRGDRGDRRGGRGERGGRGDRGDRRGPPRGERRGGERRGGDRDERPRREPTGERAEGGEGREGGQRRRRRGGRGRRRGGRNGDGGGGDGA